MSYQTRRVQRINQLVEAAINRIESHIKLTEIGNPSGVTIGIKDFEKSNPDTLAKIASKTDVNVVDSIKEADEVAELIDITDNLVIEGKLAYVSGGTSKPGDKVEFTTPKGKTYTATVSNKLKGKGKYLLKDIKLTTTSKSKEEPVQPTPTSKETPKEKQVKGTQQEDAIYNLKNWATQLQVPIGDGEESSNGAIKFSYYSPEAQQPISILVLSNGLVKMSGHSISDFSDFKNIIDFHKDNN